MDIWLTLVAVLVIDRITKFVVINNLSLFDSIVVIPRFFHITYIQNPGAAFGILAGQKWLFIIITFIFLGAIIYFQKRVPLEQKAIRICMGLIGGGAVGNLIDRLAYGKVIDFLDFKVWPYIFNFADSCLVVGGLLLALLLLKTDKQTKPEEECKGQER